jgi:hypothetical protein
MYIYRVYIYPTSVSSRDSAALFLIFIRCIVEDLMFKDPRHIHIIMGQAATVRNSHAAGGLMAIHLSGVGSGWRRRG